MVALFICIECCVGLPDREVRPVTFVITEPCIDTMDQSCVDVCPVDCIHFEEGKDRMLYIDPAECIDCGACQPACPVSAIFPEGDVPGNQQHFTEINSLWFQDADAARQKVGGGGGAAAPAAEPAETPAAAEAAQEAPAAEAQTVAASDADEAQPDTAPATADTREEQVAASSAPVAAEYVEGVRQVPATSLGAPAVSTYHLPPMGGFITLALFSLMFVLIWTVPGPQVLEIAGVAIGATVIVLTPLVLLFGLLFVITQARDMALFSAHHDEPSDFWRERSFAWRRNEESRRHYLEQAVQAIAAERFAFPNEENPDLRTYVNLPEPQFGIEPLGTGEKLFPDIVTVEYPGYYPVAIGQVETRETVSREQAAYVWARLENRQCPLYLYVPAGMLSTAKKYAKAAGVKNVRFRTWRWMPNGMVVSEA